MPRRGEVNLVGSLIAPLPAAPRAVGLTFAQGDVFSWPQSLELPGNQGTGSLTGKETEGEGW